MKVEIKGGTLYYYRALYSVITDVFGSEGLRDQEGTPGSLLIGTLEFSLSLGLGLVLQKYFLKITH